MTNTVVCQRLMTLHEMALCFRAQCIGERRAQEIVKPAQYAGFERARSFPDYYERNREKVELREE